MMNIKVGDLFRANGPSWIEDVNDEKMVIVEIDDSVRKLNNGAIFIRVMWLTGPHVGRRDWFDDTQLLDSMTKVE